MSTKGSNTVSRHHGETLPTLHVPGKVNGASWGSDCFSGRSYKSYRKLKGYFNFWWPCMLLSFATCTYTAHFIIERNINWYVYAAVTGHQI